MTPSRRRLLFQRSSLLDGLVSFYKLDEPSGPAFDAAGSNHLTANNNPLGYGVYGGKVGQARRFVAASSQQLSVAHNAGLGVGDEDFAVCAWVKLASKTTNRAIISKWNVGVRQFLLQYSQGSDRFVFTIDADGAATTQASATANNLGSPSVGVWYFIIAWHDASNNLIGIEVNRGTANTTAWANGTTNLTGPVALSNNSGSGYMDGDIDEASYFRKVLSVAEKDELYRSGEGLPYANFSAGLKTNLISHWALEEDQGQANDSHSTNHMTQQNSPVASPRGRVNGGRFFSASSNQYLSAVDNGKILMGVDGRITISTFVNLASITGDGSTYLSILAKGNPDLAGGSFHLAYRTATGGGSSKFRFSVRKSDNSAVASADSALPTPAVAGTWYHLLGWYDGAATRIRVNNGATTSVANTLGIFSSSHDLQMGRLSGGGHDMDGMIDELGIWNRVLTETEMAYLYNSGFGRTYPFL